MTAVLAVNAGSSSLKFGVYARDAEHALHTGVIENLQPGGKPTLKMNGDRPTELPLIGGDLFGSALAALRDSLSGTPALAAVSHRIVHGGTRFVAPVRLDDAIVAELRTLEPLAPLHQPHNLAGVQALRRAWPELPQVGCFDTAFHATIPEVESRFALPAELHRRGVRRYGFHGLSYQYLVRTLRQASPLAIAGRALLAHLGNGASLCATVGGRSVATSMGFSALDGLMMGTRCGSLDAGVVLHLLREGWDADRLEKLFYKESGLFGVSGISADMRTLRASDDPRAKTAIDLFAHRARREVGALVALMEGVDLIAFTGGIGEHDALTRDAIAGRLGHLGVRLDDAANAAAGGSRATPIHARDSAVEVWVVPTDEGRVAAQAAWSLLEA